MKLIPCLVVVLLAVTSCTAVCACPPVHNPPSALVWGRVTMDRFAPAPGASIRAAVTEATTPCVQGTMAFVGHANSEGRYRLAIEREQAPLDACVFLRAAYPGEAPATRAKILGPFRLTFSVGAPVDSVHVNFSLEPVANESITAPRR